MKNIITMLLVCLSASMLAQSKSEKITKEFSFEVAGPQNTLIVDNINGNITTEAYSGSTVMVEVEKTVTGKTQARLDQGFSSVQLGVIDRADTLILFVQGLRMPYGKVKNEQRQSGGWGYQWNNCRDSEEFDYKMDFRIKVPANVNLVISTVNDGNVSVINSAGKVHAANVNGAIALKGITHAAYASTVNGDVDITYSTNPDGDCRFYTLNGDINAYVRKGLSSRVSFKSFNGDFYTNVPKLESLPIQVEKKKTDKGMKFEITGNQFKTGNGGALLAFETFNGNVYLREQ